MDIPELPYSLPRVVKGRTINKVPTGSTIEKEVAKQSWYVEFFFHNAAEERMERIRVTRKLNRIKDLKEKSLQFNRLCDGYKIAFEGGWSPIDEKANDKLKRQVSSLTLEAAKKLFEEYHIAKGIRKNLGSLIFQKLISLLPTTDRTRR